MSALAAPARRSLRFRPAAGHLLGFVVAAVFIAPIAWTVLASFKPPEEARQPPLPPWPTTGASLQNYATLDSFGSGFWHSALNSIAVALGTTAPQTTEEAQYAIGFPLAAAIAHGRVTGAEIAGEGLSDPATLAVLRRVRLTEDEALSTRFPAERLATVTLTLRDGTVLRSPVTAARGSADNRLTDDEVSAKFRALASSLGTERCQATEAAIRARCTALVPELRGAPVVSRGVGLRPGRPTVRVERIERDGRPVVCCYGHGGAGVTLSWGCSADVVALVG